MAQRTSADNSLLAERVDAAINPVVTEAGLFLEFVSIRGAGARRIVEVIVDLPSGPGGVGSDQLADVSRAVSKRLDDVDLIESAYLLEVSTPGTDRPLTEPRHFSRAEGRLITAKLTDGTEVQGRVLGADGDTVSVCVDDAVRTLTLSDIERARVDVELGRKE